MYSTHVGIVIDSHQLAVAKLFNDVTAPLVIKSLVMERGLLWLPLLAVFIGLAWAGWNEYEKIEAYKTWAEKFQRAKYDIYAVLGQQDDLLTWGLPTRRGPINLATLSLKQVGNLTLLTDNQAVDIANPPLQSRRVTLSFLLKDSTHPQTLLDAKIEIPFTDLTIAIQWFQHLQKEIQRIQSASAD